MTTLQWPDQPKCHDNEMAAQRFGKPSWRLSGEKAHPNSDHVESFRSCSYCGSIHPEDLVSILESGAHLGHADWKYGWPHKFYIDGIINLNKGNLVRRTTQSIAGETPTEEELASARIYASRPGCEIKTVHAGYFSSKTGKPVYSLAVFEPDGPTTHGKFYNQHLVDLEPEAFAVVAAVLLKHSGIQFVLDEKGLQYRRV